MVPSRNAAECEFCAEWLPKMGTGTVIYRDVSKWVGPEAWTHCTSCHSRDHNACEGCGACLGDHDTGEPTPTGYLRTYKLYRSDKRYCSNACRQRAYRRRKA